MAQLIPNQNWDFSIKQKRMFALLCLEITLRGFHTPKKCVQEMKIFWTR